MRRTTVWPLLIAAGLAGCGGGGTNNSIGSTQASFTSARTCLLARGAGMTLNLSSDGSHGAMFRMPGGSHEGVIFYPDAGAAEAGGSALTDTGTFQVKITGDGRILVLTSGGPPTRSDQALFTQCVRTR